jgi:hypothetical protein
MQTHDEPSYSDLIGSWRLVSLQFRMSDNGEVVDEPMDGFCTFDAGGRWTFVGIPADLAGPTNDQERAAVFSRTVAFSGKCTLKGNQLDTKLDVAWNPAFKGFEFTRFIELRGDRLTVIQPEWKHPFFNGRLAVAEVRWERDAA